VLLALVLCVRDEADVIADFLHYHLARAFDPIFARDTGSVDATRRILAGYGSAVECTAPRSGTPWQVGASASPAAGCPSAAGCAARPAEFGAHLGDSLV
jgi:hypothetical protein